MKKIFSVLLFFISLNIYSQDIIGNWRYDYTSNDYSIFFSYGISFLNNGTFEYRYRFDVNRGYENIYKGNYEIINNQIYLQVTYAWLIFYQNNDFISNWFPLNEYFVYMRNVIYNNNLTLFPLSEEEKNEEFNKLLLLNNKKEVEYKINSNNLEFIYNGYFDYFISFNNSIIFTKY